MERRIFLPPTIPWADESVERIREIVRGLLPERLRGLWDAGAFDPPPREDPYLRPLLLFASARHYGRAGSRAERLAAGVHMIHLASLCHDRLGRGAPVPDVEGMPEDPETAVHQREALDILLGDLFFSKACNILVEDGDLGIIRDNIETSRASAEAQAVLVAGGRDPHGVPPEKGFEASADKVSLLLSMCLRMGAVLGEAPSAEIEALSRYGALLGRAIRIRRDVAFWDAVAGQSPEEVPLEARFAHPLVLLAEREGVGRWRRLVGGISPTEEGSPRELAARLRGGGYLEGSRRVGAGLAERAAAALIPLGATAETAFLREVALAPFSVGRSPGREVTL